MSFHKNTSPPKKPNFSCHFFVKKQSPRKRMGWCKTDVLAGGDYARWYAANYRPFKRRVYSFLWRW